MAAQKEMALFCTQIQKKERQFILVGAAILINFILHVRVTVILINFTLHVRVTVILINFTLHVRVTVILINFTLHGINDELSSSHV